MRHRNEIDGLRCIAVLLTIAFHISPEILPGGYVGVDVFFVISGYLISRQILDQIEAGTFTFADFYERRVRRIFPALFATCALTFVIGAFVLSPADMRETARGVVSSLFATSNIMFWRDSRGYFVPDTEYLTLLHTWSLGVEEQFYFVWPVVLLVTFRYWRSALLPVMALLCLLSLAASQYWLSFDAAGAFYLTPFRLFELGAGALCLFAPKIRYRETATVIGLILIFGSALLLTAATPFPGINALPVCVGTGLILCSQGSPIAGLILTNRVSQRFGLISYSLYLVHWPLIVFTKYFFTPFVPYSVRAIVVLVSVLAAALMQRYVEAPFRRRRCGRRTALFATAGSLAIALTLVSVTAISQAGWPGRLSEEKSKRNYLLSNAALCDVSKTGYCPFGDPAKPLGAFLIGNSHALHLVPMMDNIARRMGIRGETYAGGGCILFPDLQNTANGNRVGYCDEMVSRFERAADQNPSIPIVISQRWVGTYEFTDQSGRAVPGEKLDIWRDALIRTIERFGRDRRYLLVGPQVEATCSTNKFLRVGPFSEPPVASCIVPQDPPDHIENVESLLRGIKARYPEIVSVLSLSDALCEPKCPSDANGIPVYYDDNHFTVAGSLMVADRAHRQIIDAISGQGKK